MDPHATLGVTRDASEAEIKRAYRALAKRHHPDGGHGSLVRFLEVQAAYEALVGPERGPAGAARPRGAGAPAPGRQGGEPRAGWARRPRPGSAGAARGPEAPRDGAAPGGRGSGGPGGPAAGNGSGAAADRRGRRRATLGSTSYDDAEELGEPGWSGASWYGPASGTYWTVNPKEYADPRKHGPEYQARARRRAVPGSGASPPMGSVPGSGASPPTDSTPRGDGPAADPARVDDDGATGARASAPDAAGERAEAPGVRRRRQTRLSSMPPPPWPRAALALLGWLPIGAAAAAMVGLPAGLVATLPVQVMGLVVLAVAPRAAWAAAGGAAALVFLALPIVAVVAALGGEPGPGRAAPPVAVGLALLAWAGGAVAAASDRVVAYPWRRAA